MLLVPARRESESDCKGRDSALDAVTPSKDIAASRSA